MNANMPPELTKPIRNLELLAFELLSKGNFKMANNIYNSIYKTLFEQQSTKNRRIHLGAPLHMMGLSFLFENDLNEAFKHFLLAYITDTINAPHGHENDADGAPACRALKAMFGISDSTLELIKEMARSYTNREAPFDPYDFLEHFLEDQDIRMESLINRRPSTQEITKIMEQMFPKLFFTESGQKLFNETISRYGSRVLNKAAEIARKEGHPKEITESDIRKALSDLEGRKEE